MEPPVSWHGRLCAARGVCVRIRGAGCGAADTPSPVPSSCISLSGSKCVTRLYHLFARGLVLEPQEHFYSSESADNGRLTLKTAWKWEFSTAYLAVAGHTRACSVSPPGRLSSPVPPSPAKTFSFLALGLTLTLFSCAFQEKEVHLTWSAHGRRERDPLEIFKSSRR